MLFPYTYVSHKMEKMQEFIDFIFHEVWCTAPVGLDFHPDLFAGCPELQEIMSLWGFSAKSPERGKRFYREVKEIYHHFAPLSPSDIDQFRKWYRSNNDIERACANDPATHPVRYQDFEGFYPELSAVLATFFKDLYCQELRKLVDLQGKISNIEEHFDRFMESNTKRKCPFCGFADLKGPDHSTREAYDHFLPKALYPFNSMNFRNLVPTCHDCNSSYKTSKDPVHDSLGLARRKAFYPFSASPHSIEIQVELRSTNVMGLQVEDVELQFGPGNLSEEIDTWRDVYGIDERYKAKYCGENDGKYWFVQATEEWPGGPLSMLENLRQKAKPYGDCNFLKKPFLEACEQAGLFAPTTTLPAPQRAP